MAISKPKPKFTPKQHVRMAEPEATLDYYESLRGSGMPCWFIRHGQQGKPYTGICKSPRAAWKAAYDSMVKAFAEMTRKKAAHA